jgi:hypothetical protein
MTSGVWLPRPGLFSFNPITRGSIDMARIAASPVHLFIVDIDFAEVRASDVQTLRSMGRIVSAYFSSGTTEPYERPDVLGLPTEVFDDLTDEGSAVDRWLNISHEAVRNLMRTRVNRAKAIGAEAIVFDFPMSVGESNKFRFTADAIDAYMRFLTETAHAANLSCGVCDLDTNVALAAQLFDFAFVTQCVADGDCLKHQDFVTAGKAVFNVEYRSNATAASPVPPVHCNITNPIAVDSVLKGNRSFYEFEILPLIPCNLKDISRSARDIAADAANAPLFTPSANATISDTSAAPLSLPVIIGIIAAAVVCSVVVIVGAFFIVRRRRNGDAGASAGAAVSRGSESTPSASSSTASLGTGVVLRSRPLSLHQSSATSLPTVSMQYNAMPYAPNGGFGSGFQQSFKTPEQVYADDLLRLVPYGGAGASSAAGGFSSMQNTNNNSGAIRMMNPTHYTYDDIQLATLDAQALPAPPGNRRM